MSRARRTQTPGAVAAGDVQTAEAGAAALRAGGNAVDAAVGAAFAAFVCEVALCGPLGGGVMTLQTADGALEARDFFGRTPGLGAPAGSHLDFVTTAIDFGATRQVFHIGKGSAAIGLALPGLIEAHAAHGRLPLTVVAAPAVELGRKGYRVGEQMAYILRLISQIGCHTPESAELFMCGDRLPAPGDVMLNPALGDVLAQLAVDPKDTLAGLFDAFARHFGPANGGLITPEDVATARSATLTPVQVRHRGWTVSTMPAPSTGGVLIALGLRLLEGVGDAEWQSIRHALTLCDVQQALLEVRAPDFDAAVRDPKVVEQLLSLESIDRLRRRMGGEATAWPDSTLGSTTHISAVDGEGGVAAMTLTNGEGCGYVLPGTGIEVNNLLGEADINPRGFHVDPPGRPMVTMMAPTIARRPDGAVMALGSGGSNRLRNAIMGTLAHIIEHGRRPADAIAAPRLHLDAKDGAFELAFERFGWPDGVPEALIHARPRPVVFDGPNMFFGGVHMAHTLDGTPAGAGDARRGGAVVVV